MRVARFMAISGLIAIVIGSVSAVAYSTSISRDKLKAVIENKVDTIPSYIDSVSTLSLEEVYSITTYLLNGDNYATVVLVDGTECYCDQYVARDLRLTINHDAADSFEVWTNNDGEHEIVKRYEKRIINAR